MIGHKREFCAHLKPCENKKMALFGTKSIDENRIRKKTFIIANMVQFINLDFIARECITAIA